jgi:hypothetical protein
MKTPTASCYFHQSHLLPLACARGLFDRDIQLGPEPFNILVTDGFAVHSYAVKLRPGSGYATLPDQLVIVELSKTIQQQGEGNQDDSHNNYRDNRFSPQKAAIFSAFTGHNCSPYYG